MIPHLRTPLSPGKIRTVGYPLGKEEKLLQVGLPGSQALRQRSAQSATLSGMALESPPKEGKCRDGSRGGQR